MNRSLKGQPVRLLLTIVTVLCIGLMGCGINDAAVPEETVDVIARGAEAPLESGTAEAVKAEAVANAAQGEAKRPTDKLGEADRDLVILYTNDIHCAVEEEQLGYAKLAAYKKQLKADGKNVLVADAGDYVQGAPIGMISKGAYIVDIMNQVPYDVAAVGNHEFDYGMDQFDKLIERANFPVVCCNLIDEESGTPLLPAYQMFAFTGRKVAFVGVTTPETMAVSNPSSFKDITGNYKYGFCQDETGEALYLRVQDSVDAARAEGADYVILLAHLGIGAESSPWMSTEVIANTKGIDAVIDGHSHSVVESEQVKNQDGKSVLLTQTGTQFANIGSLTISKEGRMTAALHEDYGDEDEAVKSYIDGIEADYEEEMGRKIGTSEVTLVIKDPDTGERIVRNMETNAGDFCADACRFVTGAEIAIVNSGGVRSDVPKGDLTYGDIISLHPFGNMVSVVEVSGQQILDALENGARYLPEENGGFLQVSGMTYEIDMNVSSSVKSDKNGSFIGVSGEYRVRNVKIDGKPLDAERNYVLAAVDYLLKDGGDGFTMFKDAKMINESFILDSEVVIEYITNGLNGHIGKNYADPYGDGRIVELE